MGGESLEAAIRRAGGPVELLRNAMAPPYTFPVAAEFSNWRSEQRAWREGCALFDQSHHMTDLFVNGPDALALLSRLAVNRFEGFAVDQAKQLVAVNDEGYLIGDGILFHLGPDRFDLVNNHPFLFDWITYNLEVGGYDAWLERDPNSLERDGPPGLYRYELQGPAAAAVVERVTGKPLPDVRFFHMCRFTIAGHEVRALRHGMAGQPGFELFGPFEQGVDVLDALLDAGEGLGLVRAGAKAYSTSNLESGWVPSPMSAVFTGEAMAGFREWRDAERIGSLGGSLSSPDVTDYYVTPADIGYGRIVSFDHDFVGRPALEAMGNEARRRKVTLVWNADDVTGVFASQLAPGLPAKYLELPKARYSLFQCDEVLHEGRRVGISMDCGHLYNEHAFVSLATVDVAVAEPGTEVVVVWGEEPNSVKPQVEPHRQVPIRATVAPAPYVPFARDAYRSGSGQGSGRPG